jgi:hypothetical protein
VDKSEPRLWIKIDRAMPGNIQKVHSHNRVLAWFNSNPGEAHWKAVKHLFCCIKGTLDYCITYLKSSSSSHSFITYSNADHCGCLLVWRQARRSSGCAVYFMNWAMECHGLLLFA